MADERKRTPFGARLSGARKVAGLTQVEVCKAVGIRQSTLSELETTANGSTHTIALARLYGVSPEWLATGSGEAAQPANAPPPRPPRNFADRHQVTPSQWALLEAVEGLYSPEQRAEMVTRYHEQRERIMAQVTKRIPRAGVRGMSLPMELDEAPAQPAVSHPRTKKA